MIAVKVDENIRTDINGNIMNKTMLKSISKKQACRNRELKKIRDKLPKTCAICGRTACDLSHLLPRSTYPEHYTNPLNIVGLCRECHNKYDNNLSFRRKQKRLIERVRSFDECAANRYFRL